MTGEQIEEIQPEEDYFNKKVKVGDTVKPISSQGLWLADVPVNGDYYQKRNNACVFKGEGKVLKIHKVIINYDEWCEQDRINEIGDFYSAGKCECRDFLIKCDNGIGWGGGITKVKNNSKRWRTEMTDMKTKAKAIMEAYYNVDTTEEEGIIALLREVVNQLQYYQCCEDEGVEDMVLDARAILDVADELEAL